MKMREQDGKNDLRTSLRRIQQRQEKGINFVQNYKSYNKIACYKARSENSQGRNEREGKCSRERYSRQPWGISKIERFREESTGKIESEIPWIRTDKEGRTILKEESEKAFRTRGIDREENQRNQVRRRQRENNPLETVLIKKRKEEEKKTIEKETNWWIETNSRQREKERERDDELS